jgi:hypothetical protein
MITAVTKATIPDRKMMNLVREMTATAIPVPMIQVIAFNS